MGRILATVLVVAAVVPANAQNVADFYRGKNVAVAIAFSPGGGYDLYARTLARHMGKYIPGNPALVPQNMPGAGGLRVAQYFSAAAPRDGLTFGTFTRMAGIAPLFDPTQKYDSAKLTWLGAITDSVSVCVTWHTSPVKTWKDFLEKPSTLGGTGPSGELDIFTNLYKNIFNANVKLVSGYPGTAEIMLAMERGELDGVCGIDWTSIKAQRERWIKEKSINVIAQAAFRKDPDLPDVPLIMELTTDREKLQILKLFVSAHEFARPYAAPPEIPAGPGHGARRRLRRDHEGRGLSRRNRQASDGGRAGERQEARCDAGRALHHARRYPRQGADCDFPLTILPIGGTHPVENKKMKCPTSLVVALLGLASPPASAGAQSVEDFYKGKTINLAIGFEAGGGYDIYGRLLARHMGQHIPGKPHDRGAKHARRRQPARRPVALFDRAQGRHRDGDVRTPDGDRAAHHRRMHNSTAPNSSGSAASPTRCRSASPGKPRR